MQNFKDLLKIPGLNKKDPEICNLECKIRKTKIEEEEREKREIFDFKGPVKVVLVDPPDEDDSESRRTASGFIALANMMIAANVVTVILFSLSFNCDKYISVHIFLCTIAFQFCLPLSILMMNPLYGPAGPLNESGRFWEHVKFIVVAMLFYIPGAYFGLKGARMKPAPTILAKLAKRLPLAMYHHVAGIIAGLYFCLLVVFVILKCVQKKFRFLDEPPTLQFCSLYTWLQYCHRYISMLTLVLCNVCYISGIITAPMQITFYMYGFLTPTIAIIFFTLCYTMILIIFPGWHYPD